MNISSGTSLSLLCAAILLSGCASPLVKYGQIKGPDETGLTKFSFSESVIKFSLKKGPAPSFVVEGIDIVSVPVPETSGNRYYVSGTSAWENWGVETLGVPAYRGDTPLIKSIALTTEDKRMSLMEKTIGAAGKALPFLVSATEISSAKLPDGIAIQPLLEACDGAPSRCMANITFNEAKDYMAKINIGRIPLDSFPQPIKNDSIYKSGSFLYSACRQVDIQLYFKTSNGFDKVAESTVMVADSNFVQTLAFPPKGTVTAGASCGATATAEPSGLPNGMDYIDTFLSSAQTFAKAKKDAKDAKAAKEAKQ
ncbi:hypothetical protein LOY38_14780 [Pseudomonas sp. B21-015]|uniref:hypothetical protein n=1 Tax=Pseudomonas sp. B21-015 TaxID=2895473 RepID=UPI00215F9A43|nr:hypothetical protein [Pseudomonas sp. B21-015]UVM47713.1 hypothetical protein LOY38_14780 [Pseudomonas sp. B21-015]